MKAWWVIVLLYQLYSFIIALQPYYHPSAATDADWEIMAIDDMKFHNEIFYLKAKWEDNSKKFRSHYQTAPLDSIYEDCKIMKENSNKEDVQENLVVKFVDCLADPEPTEVVEYVSFVKAIAKLAKAKPSALFSKVSWFQKHHKFPPVSHAANTIPKPTTCSVEHHKDVGNFVEETHKFYFKEDQKYYGKVCCANDCETDLARVVSERNPVYPCALFSLGKSDCGHILCHACYSTLLPVGRAKRNRGHG